MSLAFVIPLISPAHPRLADYTTVDRMLRLTVQSLMRQSLPRTFVAVAGHRRPPWLDQFGERALFADVGDHQALVPGGDVQIDTGLKKAVAGMCAIVRWSPDHIMLVDADDFIDTSFAYRLAVPSRMIT